MFESDAYKKAVESGNIRDAETIYMDAFNKLGAETQLRQCQEECAELIVAISHLIRDTPGAMKNLVEEIADVRIMLDQLMFWYGKVKKVEYFERDVEFATVVKLLRLSDRLGMQHGTDETTCTEDMY